MARYFYDWDEYADGTTPVGISNPWNAATEVIDRFTYGVATLKEGVGQYSEAPIIFSGNPTAADSEILVRVRTSVVATGEFDEQMHLYVRGSGNAFERTGYILGAVAGSTLRLFKTTYASGTGTQVTTLSDVAWPHVANTWYWMRLKVSGTTLQAKAWTDGTTEPATWSISTTDSSITGAGWTGFGSAAGQGHRYFSQVGIGTGGDVAPAAVIPTYFSTDFDEYPDGFPADWSAGVGGSTRWSVVDGVLVHTNTGTAGDGVLTWDDVSSTTGNGEILAIVEVGDASQTTYQNSIWARYSTLLGAPDTPVGYNVYLFRNSSGSEYVGFDKYPSGTAIPITNYLQPFDVGQKICIRYRYQGSSHKIKSWIYGNSEPAAWDVEVTDDSIVDASRSGVGGYSPHGTQKFYYFSVATSDGTAQNTYIGEPLPAPEPISITGAIFYGGIGAGIYGQAVWGQGTNLPVSDLPSESATVSVSAGEVGTLVQNSALSVDSATVGVSATSTAVVQNVSLAPDNASVVTSSTTLILVSEGVIAASQPTIPVSATSPALIQQHMIAVNNATVAPFGGTTNLIEQFFVQPENGTVGVTVNAFDLALNFDLYINDAAIASSASTSRIMYIADIYYLHTESAGALAAANPAEEATYIVKPTVASGVLEAVEVEESVWIANVKR